jgi:hypothetical protein
VKEFPGSAERAFTEPLTESFVEPDERPRLRDDIVQKTFSHLPNSRSLSGSDSEQVAICLL